MASSMYPKAFASAIMDVMSGMPVHILSCGCASNKLSTRHLVSRHFTSVSHSQERDTQTLTQRVPVVRIDL